MHVLYYREEIERAHKPVAEVFLDVLISIFSIFIGLAAEGDLAKTDTSCVIGSDDRKNLSSYIKKTTTSLITSAITTIFPNIITSSNTISTANNITITTATSTTTTSSTTTTTAITTIAATITTTAGTPSTACFDQY